MQEKKESTRKGPRPHTWVTGPCPKTHKQYRVFIQQRNQANFRKEGWDLSFEDWKVFWEDGKWEKRGRTPESLSMTRIDETKGWIIDNVEVLTRREIYVRYGKQRRGMKYNKNI